jgi:hypothetical protein
MGYSQFTNVKPPPPKEKPNPNDRADTNFALLVPSGHSKAQKALPPAGPYHVNHFICYFKVKGASYTDVQGKQTAAILTYHFLRNFCFIFSEQNIARAQYGPRGLNVFNGSKTVEFTIGSNVGTAEHRAIGFIHPDWVAMSSTPAVSIQDLDDINVKELSSFHGDTLRRYWDTVIEKKLYAVLGGTMTLTSTDTFVLSLLPSPFDKILTYMKVATDYDKARGLLEFNKFHFLAGTRSWRVAYDTNRKEFFVETVTIERFSCWPYEMAEKQHSTRDDILNLWDNLLNNFIKTKVIPGYRFDPVPPPDLLKNYGYAPSPILKEIRHDAWKYPTLKSLLEAFIAKPPTAAMPPPVIKALQAHRGLHVHMSAAG